MAEFKLPDVGEGIESGTVVSVLVAVGDTIEVDQPVIELETDKAVVEVPSSVAGTVEAINVKENDEATVGQVILTLSESATAAPQETEPEPANAKASTDKAASTSAADSDSGETQAFNLPELGEGIESGTVVAVLVSAGDTIKVDDPVIELETDKAVVEVPSSVSGTVQAVNVKNGDEAAVGQLILTVGGSSSAPAKADSKPDPEPAKAATAKQTETPAKVTTTTANQHTDSKLIPAAPSVRRLARELGVQIQEVPGSGIMNRISADDVRRFADGDAAPTATPQAPASAAAVPPVELPDFSKWGETERVPMSGIRKATVRAMTQAWSTVPMVTQFDKADITDFEAMRQQYKAKAEAAGAKLTPTAMLLKIVAGALRKFPDFNASIDTSSNEVIYKSFVNIGVAVDTPNGLLVPVIKHADQKNIIELAAELGELAAKARDRKLSPDEMQGGNFNISNLGGIGGTNFTPIVNPPQVAILGVSRGGMEPVWDKASNSFQPRNMMPLSLTYDHRLIDGAAAARFSRWLCEAIENPFLIMLEG